MMRKIGVTAAPLNRKMYAPGKGPSDMPFQPRVRHRRGRGKKLPSFIIRCGCCPAGPVEIYYDHPTKEAAWATLEINGVDGSIQDWRDILLPFLGFKRMRRGWADKLPSLKR